ncbi:hypothetical protein BDV10DRAFT_182303 [Aspergillus recurvatus]
MALRSLVLQGLPRIIEEARAQVDGKITDTAHAFAPQPVKGSQAYFMHAVLREWPDDSAKQLLVNTGDPMVAGNSQITIYDIVLP